MVDAVVLLEVVGKAILKLTDLIALFPKLSIEIIVMLCVPS